MAKRAGGEALVWTEAGRAALAEEKARGTTPLPAAGDDVATAAAAVVKKYAPRWKKGAAKADAAGNAAAAFAVTWKPGTKATPEQLAGLVSLAAASSDDVEGAVIEHVVRAHGAEVAMRVLVATWSQYARYDKGAAWLTAIGDDDQHVFDTSACSGKGEMTRYLQRRHHASSAADRAAMKRAADAVWKQAPRHARVGLAVATNDAKRAAEITRDLLANDRPYPFFAWDHLPEVLVDAELVTRVIERRGRMLSHRIVENLGAAAIPLFETRIADRIDKHTRARVLATMSNIRSPRVARILAEYAEQKPYDQIVRTYFTMHPDLLDEMLADPELRYYHDDLRVLKAPA